MSHDLVTAAFGAAGALVVALSSQVVAEGLTRRREAGAQRAADRAELQAQADELYAAVLALKAAGTLHVQLMSGARARTVVLVHAAAQWLAEWARSEQNVHGALAGVGKASAVISQWDRQHAVSAAGLAGCAPDSPEAADSPLARHPDRALAEAAGNVFETVVNRYQDDDGANGCWRRSAPGCCASWSRPCPGAGGSCGGATARAGRMRPMSEVQERLLRLAATAVSRPVA
ncbi:hypothetical protein ACFWIJ_40300 [Streptomyces sp. NPDC127079]|uniref:hypothetical protein n=1 Tax=Streptomyces sp. NPDC127079 TaxID=3347132 RepID=UPI00366834B0